MIDLFGIRRRREEREKERIGRLKKDREKKIEYKQTLIDPYLKAKEDEAKRIGKEEYDKELSKCEEKNSVCPKCGGKTIINKFLRVQGKIEGKSRSYGFSSSGDIDGEIDTFKVNECKDCGHQWELSKPEYELDDYTPHDFDPYNYCSRVGTLYRSINRVLEGEKDLEEIKYLECFKDTPKEVIEYLLYCWYIFDGYHWGNEDTALGIKIINDEKKENYNHSPYLFTITDEVWTIAKKLIGR